MKKYNVLDIIGKGSFSNVYRAINVITNNPVAIKMATNKDLHAMDVLIREAKLYNYLKNIQGVPQLYWCGRVEDMYYIVMPLYMGTLKTYVVTNVDKLYAMGNMLLSILKEFHSLHIIHRDIKPDNIMYDHNDNLFIIDLGLCAMYTSKPYEPTVIGGILGTPNYVSVNVHELISPYMKDDTESLMYVLMYVWNSHTLPWMNIEHLDEIKIQKYSVRDGNMDVPFKIIDYLRSNDEIPYNIPPAYIL
jgi:serine/threonine protein kinase